MKRCVGHLKLTFQALRFSQLSVRVGPSSPKRSQAKRGETRKPNGTKKAKSITIKYLIKNVILTHQKFTLLFYRIIL